VKVVNAAEKSADGIVSGRNEPVEKKKNWRTHNTEGQNGMRKQVKGEVKGGKPYGR